MSVELEEAFFRETHTLRHVDEAIEMALRAANRLERLGTKEFVGTVDRMRQEIILAVMEVGELSPATADTIKRRTKSIVERYHKEFERKLSDNQRRQFVKGIQIVDKAIKSADLIQAVPYLSEQILAQLKDYNAELITGITDEARRRIAQEIDLAVMGQKDATEVIKAIGRNLKSPSIFRTIARRAEIIHRQEINRIQNIATIRRMEQTVERIPDLRKKWLHSHVGVPRPGHLALHQVTIPVQENFKLIGADGKIYHIGSPHDPILPAGEVIGCRCKLTSVVGRFEKKALDKS